MAIIVETPLRKALVVNTLPLFDNSRLVTLTMSDDEPLGFVGGQHITVDTGEKMPDGSPATRAYSIVSADIEQRTVSLAILRGGIGPGSGHMLGVKIGDEVTFHGPMGTLRPRGAAPAPTLVCATDSGITSALGLVRGEGFRGLRRHTDFVWLKPSDDYLLPDSMVRDFLPTGLHHVHIATCANEGDVERAHRALQTTGATSSYENAYVAGDDGVNAQLETALTQSGTHPERILRDAFFDPPQD